MLHACYGGRRSGRYNSSMRILTLLTDAYGGRGGIAQFNRELLGTLCAHPEIDEVTVLVRSAPDDPGQLPPKIRFPLKHGGSKLRFAVSALAAPLRRDVGGLICGHINLLPLAAIVSRLYGVPLILIIHGIDAWEPHPSSLVRRALRSVRGVVSVSEFTKTRFLSWAPVPSDRVHVLPNCVDTAVFTPGARNTELLRRFSLRADAPILLTVARLSSRERYKGLDEILELLPQARTEVDGLQYLIVGDGDDRARLKAKAASLGVGSSVAFAGYVSDAEKLECYRTADAFVMLSKGEGFGIVYLEALACGLPVIASSLDASREALLNGVLGQIVDPERPADVLSAILRAIAIGRGKVNPALETFSRSSFRRRWFRLLQKQLGLWSSEGLDDEVSTQPLATTPLPGS